MIISRKHTKLIAMATSLVAVLAIAIYGWTHLPTTNAADMSKFDPGNIMSDAVMSNKDSMNVQQIQAFLESKNPCNNTNVHMAAWYPQMQYTIRDGKFVCMAKDTFNGKSAAQIIWQASQDYSINPQFLIVLLEKEQSLVTDTWPNHVQYRTATGFGCPDTAACDSQYFGLENQIRNAANLFRNVLSGGWSNYPVGNTYVQYNPNAWCGGTIVNIQNRATSALYRYTPYQPNQSALNAGYGTGDGCGAYGNRNTYALFTDWFGSSTSGVYLDIAKASQDIDKLHSQQSNQMASPVGNAIPEYDSAPRVWRNYEKGVAIWTPEYGAYFIPYNSTYQRWRKLGGSVGSLGVPRSAPVYESSDGRTWQNFSGGFIIYTNENGGWEIVPGPIADQWTLTGGSLGALKRPLSGVTINSSGYRQQQFENGLVVRRDHSSPAYAIIGNMSTAWSGQQSSIGPPTSSTTSETNGHTWQSFKNGVLIQLPSGQIYPVTYDGFYNKWQQLGGSFGALGRPASSQTLESDGRLWQNFENGVIIKKTKNSAPHEIVFGPIYTRWQAIGGSLGILGTPQSSAYTESDGRSWQDFEKGTIIESPQTGAWEVEGNFYGYWKEYGGSLGLLGKPTGPKYIEENDARWQPFENGKIVWSPRNGWSIEKT
ncbi:hypothetical protein EOM60_01430 [Candidatus Saccharibacteria bacterium]|nr:hypothetical protein [Candidatus Saccharibacteria bacterium]